MDHSDVGRRAVLRDLVDAAVAEGLGDADGDTGRLGPLRARLRAGSATTPWRLADGADVRDDAGRALEPDEVLATLLADVSKGPFLTPEESKGPFLSSGARKAPTITEVAEDLRTAAAQAGALAAAWERLPDAQRDPHHPRAGERLAVLRGRPFHPTARAVSGWSASEAAELGPMRTGALPLRWVAVRRDHLRLGPGADSRRLHERVVENPAELDQAMAKAGVDVVTHQPLPVHPWQAEHVLEREFAAELAAGVVVTLDVETTGGHPTSSLRTLALSERTHLKLPLGVATLGATRLLPPRYLDNADRAEATMREALNDPLLSGRVTVCGEGTWAGWAAPDGSDEFADRPGHLAAQIRDVPAGPLLPLGALAAAQAWEGLDVGDPVAFLVALAEGVTTTALGFLRHGVLPELHGQNVLVRLGAGGRVEQWVLRDHDTLRVFGGWRDVTDPGYRIRPGARQTLRLDGSAELVGYFQTLGLQVAIGGVVDALSRALGRPERTLWAAVREGVEAACTDAPVLRAALLDAPRWPLRTVLGPLLERGRDAGVSMPAGTGSTANPLLADGVDSRQGEHADRVSGATPLTPNPSERAHAEHRARLLNCLLRETTPPVEWTADRARIELPATARSVVLGVEYRSASGHHAWCAPILVDGEPAGHDDLVATLLAELGAVVPDADVATLAAHIDDSVTRTARYLAHRSPSSREDDDPVRAAEQSVRVGHPFHPTPKSAEGFDDAELHRWAPELGAAFRLHHWRVAPELLAEEGTVPDDVSLPLHPFQEARLRRDPLVEKLITDGGIVPLGPGGPEVYATSSTRTVAAPGSPIAWKLPLHVRLTHYVRTTPPEQARRAVDVSAVVTRLRERWEHPGFAVLVESGYRGLASPELAAETTVVFREQRPGPHRVLAALIERGPDGDEPPLVAEVRASGLGAHGWLRAYLRISLLPLLAVFAADGVGFEAHPQNALLATEGGRPTGFRVRDMEGAHVSRDRCPAGLAPDSPAVYDEDEAWRRLRYHAVVNGLGAVVATLGRHLGDEPGLWRTVAETLRSTPGNPYAEALRRDATLPAKANLLSRLAERGETPLFVDVPNPIRVHG